MTTRPWLASYPRGVPEDIDADRYGSLNELLEASFERFASSPAFYNRGTTLSFDRIERHSRAMAAYLQSLPGIARGDRVAVMLPNLLQSPVVLFGILRAGLVVVNVNPLYTPRELRDLLMDSGARVLVVLENFASTVAAADVELDRVVVTKIGDHFPLAKRWLANFVVKYVKRLVPVAKLAHTVAYRRALSQGAALQYRRPILAGDDIAFLQYTGGTTGRPQAAMLTHRNIVGNILQGTAWIEPFFDAAQGDTVTALPLYHIFALTVNLFAFTVLGTRNVLITNPRDLKSFVAELGKVRFAFTTGVNTLFNALLNDSEFRELDFSALQICLGGGMAVQRDVAERWRALTGTIIAQGYGLTEASPIVSASPLDADEFDGSVGLPLPSTNIMIVDDQGRQVAPGESGEICVQGPQVMAGYWNQPEASDATFLAGRWLKTGDIGRLDERGYLFIEDRKKDLILVSGFNVSPNEVEDVVTQHPGVHEAAVIGVPSAKSGEAVKLFVVRRDETLGEAEILAHCRVNLAAYKIPEVIEFTEELPKTSVGKVLRRALRPS